MLNLSGGRDKNTTERNAAVATEASESENEKAVRKGLSSSFAGNTETSTAAKINSVMAETETIDKSKVNLLKKNNDGTNSDNKNISARDGDDVTDIDEDTLCGIGSFRPKWIQSWATSKIFLLFFGATGITQGMFFAYRLGVLSTLEKRFAYDSRTSGSIVMVEEVTPVFLGALLGYFGSKGHRSRNIAAGMFASVLCSYICAIPYFIYGPASEFSSLAVENKTTEDMCVIESKTDTCTVEGKPTKVLVVFIFMIAGFFQGFGTIAYHAVGVPYMDDITKKKNVPIYLAATHALRFLGPASGFLLSSIFLKYNENPFVDPGFGPDDPRWIGAWWLGFIVQGSLLFTFTVPLLFFPKRLPKEKKIIEKSSEKQSVKSQLLGFLTALRRLATNYLVIFLCLNIVINVHGGIGHFMMLPRYMEQQFRLSAANASLYSGPPALMALIFSQMAGGVFIWKFRPKVKTLIISIIALELVSCAGCLILMTPHCEKIALSNSGYDSNGLMVLENECNGNCNCSLKSYTPVCGSDGATTYFSPCFAGCKDDFSDEHNKKVFTNCTCADDLTDKSSSFVTEGYCFEEGCWSQALLYITLMIIFQIMTNFLKVAYTMILLRSVSPEDKSVCLGSFEMALCLFGFIPQPVISGAMMDSACLVWEKSCGSTGNCWFYDVDKFNYLMHGLSAFFQIVAVVWFIGIYVLRHQIRDLYEDEECEPDDRVKSSNGEVAADVPLREL